MKKHVARLKRLVEGLPRVEPDGRQALIWAELQAIEDAFRHEKDALADAVRHYVVARSRRAPAEERATLYRRVTDALRVLVQAVEHGKRS
jgi:hypothetical protein